MARPGLTITDPTTGQTITFVETAAQSDGQRLVLESTYLPKAGKPPLHKHPGQEERFEVLDGTLEVRVGRKRRSLTAGETIAIPAGTPHAMGGDARVRWEIRPALATEEFLEAVCDPHAPPTARLAAAWEHRDEFRLTGPAAALLMVAGRFLAREQ